MKKHSATYSRLQKAGWTNHRVIVSGWSETKENDKLSLHIMPGRSMSDA